MGKFLWVLVGGIGQHSVMKSMIANILVMTKI